VPTAAGVRAADRPACTRHTYRRTHSTGGVGHFTITATVTYQVWLTTSDDPGRRLADTITGPAAELGVTVREIQAVIR
jgi:hypothetical protein